MEEMIKSPHNKRGTILTNVEDLLGTSFNSFVVESYSHKQNRKNGKGYDYYYKCRCKCGSLITLSRMQIVNKTTKNCGCNKTIRKSRLVKRIGEEHINKQGLRLTITNYTNSSNIDVVFDDGYVVKHRVYKSFINGKIVHPYYPNNKWGGWLGEGKYNFIDYKIIYQRWAGMMKRCYLLKEQNLHPTYIDCTVCAEWHNYQNFAKWHEENAWDCGEEKLELDKDILIKGNKVYSPETCVFTTKYINTLFTKSNTMRGNTPIGVIKSSNTTYMARLSKNNKGINLGSYTDINEAFNAYKIGKEQYIKEIADQYREKYPQFPVKLYEAMYNYQVEITD